MRRHLNFRQIEAFKAVIESGTVSRAALLLNISQPAMSRLIAHLEVDTGLMLFDRVKGRLVPTEHAVRLHSEIDRIFAGVRQVENAVEVIHREEQGRLDIGVSPPLAGSFIQRAITRFLKDRQRVFCSVDSLISPWIVDRLVARKLDVGLVAVASANPYVTLEPLMECPMVCIMPRNHPLAAKHTIKPSDLDDTPFVGYPPDSHPGLRIAGMFEMHRIKANIAIVSNAVLTVCELVASGFGVSLVHPLDASATSHRLTMRRFEPELLDSYQLCCSVDSRNSKLVQAFAQEVRATAAQVSDEMFSKSHRRRRGRRT
jgi:DNA-binding transcriptional LysR family regulator